MTKPAKEQLITVGIGASAGGLAVLKEFVRSLPPKTGMAYIIVQHLDPDHESLLSNLLAKVSGLPVEEVRDGVEVAADHVYVLPPDAYVELEEGRLRLIPPPEARGFRKAIDHFFRTLARECGSCCVGIVLSGAGSDGTAGLRAIKAAGGLSLAQEPTTAEHSSMPESAINADVIDKVVLVGEMYPLLKQYASHPLTREFERTNQKPKEPDSAKTSLETIAVILKTHENFDFDQYKPTTVQRRIARRMGLTNSEKYADYLDLLRNSKAERNQLTKDLLINVTDFFRDTEAFEFLEDKVIPDILDGLDEGEEIRIWVPGCASGEEAYSIAILFLEALAKRRKEHEVKLFATDIDEHAIKTARQGRYPESIAAEVPQSYLDKYFTQIEDYPYFQIQGFVRDLITFAIQNVATDPPFNHMHLISCRNLLIYLKRPVQEKVLSSFYFALNEESAYLFLGSSESLGNRGELFKTVSKKWRIYGKVPGTRERKVNRQHLFIQGGKGGKRTGATTPDPSAGKSSRSLPRSERMRRSLLDAAMPPTILIDEEGKVLFTHGDLDPYVVFPKGEPRMEIARIVNPAIRSRLRSAIYKVKKSQEPLNFRFTLPLNQDGHSMSIRTQVVPIQEPDYTNGRAYAISFHSLEENDRQQELTADDETTAENNLELELAETREELHNTIEELETSTEELKASHEEALSTNEELQSSNEELEASSEELRSLNEELSTVNAQLKEKIEELKQASDDIRNFFSSTDLPTIFLDPDLNIQRYTPAAEQLLKMGPRDIGRPIYSLGRDLVDDDLSEECQIVLRNFQPQRKEIQDYQGRWFVRQVTPYRTEDRRVEGVVLIFQNITNLKKLSQRAETRERQQSVVARLGILALAGVEPEELMRQTVRQVAHVLDVSYCKVLKYQPEQKNLLLVAGTGWRDVQVGQTTVPADQHSQAGYTLLSQEPVIVVELAKEKRFQGPELLTQHDVVSGISCLINHSSPPYGVLGAHTLEKRHFTEDDANFMVSVANLLSTAIRSREAQSRIAESESQLRMAKQAARIGIHDYYIRQDRVYWDAIVREIWNVPEGQELITFQDFTAGIHPDDLPTVNQAVEKSYETGHYFAQFRVIDQEQGSVTWVEATGNVMYEDREPVRLIGTVQDISQQKTLEHSLQQAISELRENDARKNDFLSILGHELRNPLAALSGSVEITERMPDKKNEMLKIMQHSIGTMSKLLDDLLDLNRVSQNKVQLEAEAVNLKIVLEDVVRLTENQWKKKDQQLRTDLAEALWVTGDRTRLEQIFTNLIVNASKYTPREGQIELRAVRMNREIQVEVQDTGVGIPPDVITKVFDPFYQVKQEGQASQGLGVGLALSKNLVEMHGGKIEVQSKGKDEGSTFSVILPARAQPAATIDLAGEEDLPRIKPGLKVLLVEDNKSILLTLPIQLEALGCEVKTAGTAAIGLQLAETFRPDAMLVDIGLPDLSGHTLAETLRARGYRGVLIAISGYSHEEVRQKSMAAGFDHHLAKPATIEAIVRRLA